ncbi:Repeat domain-containing protein [Aquiflexum balticum DSM 16537]|uniref:Repeat domain-containing protein n=1 Tax=Aquiflexum balticum DSM 16537 TaxID=758820 RepID=A0A1W2H6N2_9BACT|nr:VCBS repeat-containing protein [Aquiflexum balticum]SMD44607.1 Repeat domain-containing protein [Aquiflexum balticum DSM 16537]
MKIQNTNQKNLTKSKNRIVLFLFLLTSVLSCNDQQSQQQSPQAVKGDQITFKKHVLTKDFVAEGVAVGDVNQDGLIDVMAGAFWFEAPNWTLHELTKPMKFEYDKGYSNAFVSQGMDVNHDGWVDFVRIGFPGKEVMWFENPKNEGGFWKSHAIYPTLGNESAGFYDLDGDGKLEIIGGNSSTGEIIWMKAPESAENPEWKVYTISRKDSPGSAPFSHGLGVSDMNGNGRNDIIIKEGWWEAPEDPRSPAWKFHPANLGEASAQMYAYDFNGDGLKDVLSSSAHELGVWWHQQIKDQSGEVSWKTHHIDSTYTQTHGVAFVDINSNGLPDFITGKRFFAHMGTDPGEFDPPYLYWYEFIPGPSPNWIRHQIDDDSGVGVHLIAEDITKDDLVDIIIANKKGVFVFEQERKQ